MALVNKIWREGDFVPPGAEPGLTRGFAWRDAVEVRTVAQIARQRFPYPNDTQPNLKTYTNLPDRTLGVRDPLGGLVFPDIVVIDPRTTGAQMVGEVETVRSLQEEPELAEKWRAFSAVGPLYLFVPIACLDRAKLQLKTARIKPAGLRVWRYMAGMDFTDVVDVRA